jgi:hypothetical protein
MEIEKEMEIENEEALSEEELKKYMESAPRKKLPLSEHAQFHGLRMVIINYFGKESFDELSDAQQAVFHIVYMKLLEKLVHDTGLKIPRLSWQSFAEPDLLRKMLDPTLKEYEKIWAARMMDKCRMAGKLTHREAILKRVQEKRDELQEKVGVLEAERMETIRKYECRISAMATACEKAELEAKHFKELYGKLKGASK